jgi:hypothetical protein
MELRFPLAALERFGQMVFLPNHIVKGRKVGIHGGLLAASGMGLLVRREKELLSSRGPLPQPLSFRIAQLFLRP